MNKRWNIFAISGLLIFAVVPLVFSIGYAVLYSFGLTGALNTGFTLGNWKHLFAEGDIISSFLYSAIIAFITVFLAVLFALYVSLFHKEAFSKRKLSYVIYLPLAFPAMVSAFFFFQFLSKAGIASRIFYNVGITSSINGFPDLVNDKFGIGIIAANLFICAPFFVLLFISRMETERIPDYVTLSQTLGATKRKAITRIVIPMLLQKTFPNIVLYFIFIFGSYEIPVLLGRSNPEMISVLAVRKLQKFDLLDIPQGYAIAVLYTITVLSILLLVLMRRKISYDI